MGAYGGKLCGAGGGGFFYLSSLKQEEKFKEFFGEKNCIDFKIDFSGTKEFSKVNMNCRICDAPDLIPTIDLGIQPWGNNFLTKDQIGKEHSYPLEVEFCEKCTCSQLNFTVPKEIMFSDHTYLSGMTATLDSHFKNLARKVNKSFFSEIKTPSILDIGSNDGTQLKHYKDLGYEILGVESSKNIADIANNNGIRTECAFLTNF